ncbi:proteasome subunit beta [Ferrimicrobium acidiphilum]|uniref:Proteasome subunit beta n=1 Tax=Ferrimicrobium acidiphilum DSM 19497 TaxID=1121877 RepID=A0A0D8FX72_9ACTN|nr:proteasome subunit beta [Ferrimicrobium acidiphilum]KJE77868.1 proteasome subunit beta precursor [Ferrimicrobium acidiphilum DSM 19497]
MALPLFDVVRDPGPDFVGLLGLLDERGARDGQGQGAASPVGGVPHGTTIAAARFRDGVVIAGDRRATEGNIIANRTIEKVFPADRFSAVAIAGAAGPAIEMVRLFQVQLEHYEKVEGSVLSLEGKANQLAQMIRGNLGMAMQGLAVVPLFAGWDLHRSQGRIFTYDIAGGKYEEEAFAATGSGGRDARATLRLGFRPGMSRDDIVRLVTKALFEAAQEDSATGGPDLLRGIFPVIGVIDESGYQRVADEELIALARELETELTTRRHPE